MEALRTTSNCARRGAPPPAPPRSFLAERGEFDPAPEGAWHLPPPRRLWGRAGGGGRPTIPRDPRRSAPQPCCDVYPPSRIPPARRTFRNPPDAPDSDADATDAPHHRTTSTRPPAGGRGPHARQPAPRGRVLPRARAGVAPARQDAQEPGARGRAGARRRRGHHRRHAARGGGDGAGGGRPAARLSAHRPRQAAAADGAAGARAADGRAGLGGGAAGAGGRRRARRGGAWACWWRWTRGWGAWACSPPRTRWRWRARRRTRRGSSTAA